MLYFHQQSNTQKGENAVKRITSLCLILLLVFSVFGARAESATAALQEMYAQAELQMALGNYAEAAEQFERIGTYSDASQMAMYAKALMVAETLGMYDVAVAAFQGLGDFKDSSQMAVYYTARGYQAAGDSINISTASDNDLNFASFSYGRGAETYSSLALFKDCLTRMTACQAKSKEVAAEQASRSAAKKEATYQAAIALEESGEYQKAISAFEQIKDYKDSKDHIAACENAIKESQYQDALALEEAGEYQAAIRAFEKNRNYKDSEAHIAACQEAIQEIQYQAAVVLEESGKYQEAIEAYKKLNDYKDSKDRIASCENAIRELEKEAKYQEAYALEIKQNYRNAVMLYRSIEDYKDCKDRIAACIEESHKIYKLITEHHVIYNSTEVVDVRNIPANWIAGTDYKLSYTYDKSGNLSKISKSGSLPETETVKTDAKGNIVSSVKTGSWSSSSNHTFKSNITYDAHGNPIREEKTYKSPDNFAFKDGTIMIFTYDYSYDKKGNITEYEYNSYIGKEKQASYKYKYEYSYDKEGRISQYRQIRDNGTVWIHYLKYDELNFLVEDAYEPENKNKSIYNSYTIVTMTYDLVK